MKMEFMQIKLAADKATEAWLENDSEAMKLRQALISSAGIYMSKHTPAQTKRLIAKQYKLLYPDGAPSKKQKPAVVAAAGYGGEPTPEPVPAKKPAGK